MMFARLLKGILTRPWRNLPFLCSVLVHGVILGGAAVYVVKETRENEKRGFEASARPATTQAERRSSTGSRWPAAEEDRLRFHRYR